MKLHDQIVTIERASTPSRAIDGDVIELLGLAPQGFKRAGGPQPALWNDSTGAARVPLWSAPNLTKSMDDAAMLMSPGWRIRSLSDAHGQTRHRAVLERGEGLETARVVGYGCNRATALLAAALRGKAFDRGSQMPKSQEFVADPAHVARPAMVQS